jgi:hypothetical protein
VNPVAKRASKYMIGPDIDLDAEVVLDTRGNRITEAVADEIPEKAMEDLYRRCGRPSLTGGRRHSPQISFRVPRTSPTGPPRSPSARARACPSSGAKRSNATCAPPDDDSGNRRRTLRRVPRWPSIREASPVL